MAAATDIRLRVLTLFYNSYDEIRRAVSFLRWHHQDADNIFPSLYAGRDGHAKVAGKTNSDSNSADIVSPTPPAVAATAASANDARGHEALVRNALRPPIAQERLHLLPNDLVPIELKRTWEFEHNAGQSRCWID